MFRFRLVYLHPVLLEESIGDSRYPVLRGYRAYPELVRLEQCCYFAAFERHGSRNNVIFLRRVAEVKQRLDEPVRLRAIYVKRLSPLLKVHRFHESEKPCKMVSMPVSNKNVIDSHEILARSEYLPLRALAAVKEKAMLVLALVAYVKRSMIAVGSRNARRSSKECDFYLRHNRLFESDGF